MEGDTDEEQVMNFMAMTECQDRSVAVRVLEQSNWDLITATNTYFADRSNPPPNPHLRATPQEFHAERLIDDYGYNDRNFYDQDPGFMPKIEMPNIFGGIGSFFGNIKDSIFG